MNWPGMGKSVPHLRSALTNDGDDLCSLTGQSNRIYNVRGGRIRQTEGLIFVVSVGVICAVAAKYKRTPKE